jgi:hypothetical protein
VRRGDGVRRREGANGLAILATAIGQRRPATVADLQRMLDFAAAPARHLLSESQGGPFGSEGLGSRPNNDD